MSSAPAFLTSGNARIAYHHHLGDDGCGILFLGGFMSDMTGSKAQMLDRFCSERGWQFTRFDYGGHGASSGEFAEGTIGQWREHALAVLDEVTAGKQILIGSSMGGWMMLMLALERPEKVAGLIGIASAPDFTERLIWKALSPEQRNEMDAAGQVTLPNCMPGEQPYPITRRLIEEGRNHLLLDGAIDIHCPVRLLHGMNDADVPWQLSVELTECIAGENVHVTLMKNGDHRLSKPEDLSLLRQTLVEMREIIGWESLKK